MNFTMVSIYHFALLLSLLIISVINPSPIVSSAPTNRKPTALVEQPPLVLRYHNGVLLKGNFVVNLVWYGKFSPIQRSIVVDFLVSLKAPINSTPQPSLYSWWKTTDKYHQSNGRGLTTSTNLAVGNQIFDENYSLGKSLTTSNIVSLASRSPRVNGISVVLTAEDVTVDGFCMSRCGTHGSALIGKRCARSKGRFAYVWVGNSVSQCPGHCAWPFHQPIYGPQTPALVSPNDDVGVDGMIINLATLLAATVTNPFNSGYFQGPSTAPLEAVSACTGVFGRGAYPGYPGEVLVDKSDGASYNAYGVNGRRYLLPAMWNPQTSACSPLE